MSILVDFRVSTDRFELGRFIAECDGLEAEFERIVPTEDRAVPYVWVTGEPGTLAELTERLETSDKTNGVTVLDELTIDSSDRCMYLYRVEWIVDTLDIVRGIIDADGAILEGETTDGYWFLRFRFRDHEDVAAFYQYLADHEITDFSIDSIYELTERTDRESDSLTHEQREALTIAAQRGYFALPREANLGELGGDLGITQQAMSERIRRGVRDVVFDTLNLPAHVDG
jgi:predicted DNA binding protein